MACSSCNSNSGTSCSCSVNTIILPKAVGEQGPQGVPGAAGATGATGAAGAQGPAGSSLIVVPCFKDNLAVYITSSTSYVTPVDFIFPGTTYFGTPTNIKIALFSSATDTTCTVRVCNWTGFLTTGTVICQKDITIIGGTVIYDLGTLSNLPASEGVFRVDVKSNNGGSIIVSSVMVIK